MEIEAYLGLGSRYSYLASTQLARIEGATGCRFRWIPIDSAELIRRAHDGASPFDRESPRGQYDAAYRDIDAARWARFYDVPYRPPRFAALGPSDMALACWRVDGDGERAAMCRAIYDEVFARGTEMTRDVLVRIASAFAVPGDASAQDALSRSRHSGAIADALAKGVFGVPTFVVENELFWGNDRLPLLEDFLSRARTRTG